MSELRTWRVWYDGRPGVNSLFQINPEVTNHLPEEFRVVHFDDYDALRAQLEQTQKMLADRIMDYTTAQGRLEVAVKLINQAIELNSEAINGLVRGFVGNAEKDVREAQATLRLAIKHSEIQITERSSDES